MTQDFSVWLAGALLTVCLVILGMVLNAIRTERERRHSQGDRFNSLINQAQLDASEALVRCGNLEERVSRAERIINHDHLK